MKMQKYMDLILVSKCMHGQKKDISKKVLGSEELDNRINFIMLLE